MDLEQINKLKPEQKNEYAQLERTFESPGWQLLAERLRAQADDAAQRELNAKSWEENRVWHGARAALLQVANYADVIEKEFAALVELTESQKRYEDEAEFE